MNNTDSRRRGDACRRYHAFRVAIGNFEKFERNQNLSEESYKSQREICNSQLRHLLGKYDIKDLRKEMIFKIVRIVNEHGTVSLRWLTQELSAK